MNKIMELPGLKLAGYYDPFDTDDIRSSTRHVRKFPTIEELFRNVDAVDLVSSGIMQFSLAKAALKNSKHLYIENPFISHPDKVIELIKLAYEANVVLKVGQRASYKTSISQIKPLINGSSIIEIQNQQVYRNRSDNWFYRSMVEDIDIVFDLVRSNVKSIKSTPFFYPDYSFQMINVRIEFTNKTLANLTWNSLSDKPLHLGKFVKTGSETYIDFIKNEIKTLTYSEKKKNKEPELVFQTDKWIVEPDDPLFAGFMGFKSSIIGNTVSIANPEEGFKSLLTIHDILKKAKEKAYL